MLHRIHYLALILMMALQSCSGKTPVDLIIHNGTIYMVDDDFSTARAMAVKDGLIVAVGREEEVLGEYKATRLIDLEENFVYPGLIDAHCHFVSYGMGLRQADLTGTGSYEEIIALLKQHQARFPSEWILGRGWDQNDWENKAFPTKDKLDKAFPGKPVLLTRIDGHGALASSEALRRANVTVGTNIEGGALITENGALTGMLIDKAIGLVRRMVPEASRLDHVRAVMEGQEKCFEVGLTSVQDAGLGYRTIDLIDSLQETGDLKIRIYAMLSPGKENYEHYLFRGVYKTDRLHVGSIKLFADGALGSRGALLLKPYADDPDNIGLALGTDAYLREQCALAYDHGYQVNTHCIGDSANRWILDMYGDFLKGKNDRRWRIEHAQIVNPGDFSKFGKYAVIPSVQSTHATSDMYWAEDRLGPDRIKGAYAYRTLLEENGWLPNGSDFPVENINPLYGYYALITRKDQDGWPEEGFQSDQAFSRQEAFRAMTIWAARSAFEENEKGSLEPGKMADFIVTDRDLLSMPEPEIPILRIRQTYLGGERVYPGREN
jgi:predicted amidohydrolase YtcJ